MFARLVFVIVCLAVVSSCPFYHGSWTSTSTNNTLEIDDWFINDLYRLKVDIRGRDTVDTVVPIASPLSFRLFRIQRRGENVLELTIFDLTPPSQLVPTSSFGELFIRTSSLTQTNGTVDLSGFGYEKCPITQELKEAYTATALVWSDIEGVSEPFFGRLSLPHVHGVSNYSSSFLSHAHFLGKESDGEVEVETTIEFVCIDKFFVEEKSQSPFYLVWVDVKSRFTDGKRRGAILDRKANLQCVRMFPAMHYDVDRMSNWFRLRPESTKFLIWVISDGDCRRNGHWLEDNLRHFLPGSSGSNAKDVILFPIAINAYRTELGTLN